MKKLLILTALTLSACEAARTYPIESVAKSTIVYHSYNSHYGIAFGLNTVYVMYGKASNGDREGTADAPDHKFMFSIKEIVEAHPDLDSPQVQAAQKRQSATITTYLGVK